MSIRRAKARIAGTGGPHRPGRLLAVLISALFLVGCEEIGEPMIPDDVRTPTVAGVVEAVDPTTQSWTRYRLAGGREIDVELGPAEVSPGGPPAIGDLLLLSSTPDERSWLIHVPRDSAGSDAGCFYADWLGRDAGDASIDVVINGVAFGLRLPKAVGFTSVDNREGIYAVWRARFCLDGEGQLLSYGW